MPLQKSENRAEYKLPKLKIWIPIIRIIDNEFMSSYQLILKQMRLRKNFF
ncbi:MAG: hypothetical protein KAI83_17210 [Thiomargarita sp.]|nr:hypothetical protein [Thiomargarita sp.]